MQFQKPLESLSGSCPASQRHAEGFSKPSAHFSLQTSAQRAPFQTELPRATTVSHRLCFYLLQRSYFLIHLSLPSPFCMASRLTCLKPRLHYIPSFLGSETCPAFSAHDLSLSLFHSLTHTHTSLSKANSCFFSAHMISHTHTHTHTLCLSKVNGCFLLPNFNFPLTYHLLSPGLPFRPLSPVSSPTPFHSLDSDFPYGLHRAPLIPGRGPLASGGAAGQVKQLQGAAWSLECLEDWI